jgi:hypothetical protein
MKKIVFAVTLAALFTANVQADTIGLYFGGQIWQSAASGLYGEKNALIDFDLKKEQQANYFIAVEHPFPLFPNVRISRSFFDTTDKTNVTQESNFDNETSHVNVKANVDADANFDINCIDYTLYYELFDNGLFSFDLGLTARDFGGAVTVMETKNTITTSRDFIWDGADHDDHDYHFIIGTTNIVTTRKIKTKEIEPMLYVATNIDLPLTGLSLFAQGDLLIDGGAIYDYQVGLSYDLVDNRMVDLNLTLGYRAEKMEFENSGDLSTGLEFKGVFVGVIVHL